MRPEHVDELRILKQLAAEACEVADHYEAEHSIPETDIKQKTPMERFDNLWDGIIANIPSPYTQEVGGNVLVWGIAPARLIIREGSSSKYGLVFEVSSDRRGRSIKAEWHFYGSEESTEPYTYTEYYNSEWIPDNHPVHTDKLSSLANLETSLTAYNDLQVF